MSTKQSLGEEPRKAKRRLTNIRTREVSLVDSPANDREFLLIKRKDAMSKKELLLFKNEAATKESPEITTTPDVEEKLETTEGVETTIETQKSFTAQCSEVLEKVPVSKALAMDSKDMFLAMSDALLVTAGTLDLIKKDLEAFVASEGATGFNGKSIEKAEGIEDGITDQTAEKLVSIIEKKGRKMKGARMQKLQGILGSLQNLIKELEGDESKVKKSTESTETATTAKDAVAAPVVEAAATAAATTEATEGTKADAATEADVVEEVTKALKTIQERLGKLEGRPVSAGSQEPNTNEDVTKSKGNSIFAGVIGPIGANN